MADQTVSLDSGHVLLGQQVLKHADRIGLAATGAAWIRDAATDHWILELATPMIDSHGPAWLYERLSVIVTKMPLPEGISMLELRLASPREALWRALSGMFDVDQSVLTLTANVLNGLALPDVVLYRAVRPPDDEALQAAALDRRYREVADA